MGGLQTLDIVVILVYPGRHYHLRDFQIKKKQL